MIFVNCLVFLIYRLSKFGIRFQSPLSQFVVLRQKVDYKIQDKALVIQGQVLKIEIFFNAPQEYKAKCHKNSK